MRPQLIRKVQVRTGGFVATHSFALVGKPVLVAVLLRSTICGKALGQKPAYEQSREGHTPTANTSATPTGLTSPHGYHHMSRPGAKFWVSSAGYFIFASLCTSPVASSRRQAPLEEMVLGSL